MFETQMISYSKDSGEAPHGMSDVFYNTVFK